MTLAKGIMFGECFTPGCDNSGSDVRGIAGQMNMIEGNATYLHRCQRCHDLVHKVLETLLGVVKSQEGITDDREACQNPAFISTGKTILAMSLDELSGAKLPA